MGQTESKTSWVLCVCLSLLLFSLSHWPHASRAEIALTDGRLMGVTRELNSTSAEDEALRRTLSQLEAELRGVNATVANKQQLLEDYLTSGFSGIEAKIFTFLIGTQKKHPEINLSST